MKKLIVLSLLLGGCKLQSERAIRNLSFYKDGRTGLCFAVGQIWKATSREGTAFTHVPCDQIPPSLIQVVQ